MEWWKLLIHFSLEKLNYLKNASLFSHFEHDFESECNSHGQSQMVMAGTLLPKAIGYENASVNNGKLRVSSCESTNTDTVCSKFIRIVAFNSQRRNETKQKHTSTSLFSYITNQKRFKKMFYFEYQKND